MQDFHEYMTKYPHNTDCGDRFETLVTMSWNHNRRTQPSQSLEEFLQNCLDSYGGTLTGALIDYLHNQVLST